MMGINSPLLRLIVVRPDNNWNWKVLSTDEDITPEFIEQFHARSWDWGKLSDHPNITIDLVVKHWMQRWDEDKLRCHPKIMTWENICKYPACSLWRWDQVTNRFGTLKRIFEHPGFPWVISNLTTRIPNSELVKNRKLMRETLLAVKYL